MDIDLPDVVADVTAAFDALREGAVGNDVDTLNDLFRDDPRTIRYGATENLYGHAEIRWLPRRALAGRRLGAPCRKTVITTYRARLRRRLDSLSTAVGARARSAGRCRPGSGSPTAGASSRRMSA